MSGVQGRTPADYVRPSVEDFGTLSELTADIHIELPTQLVRVAAAAMGPSTPFPAPGGGGGGTAAAGKLQPGGGGVADHLAGGGLPTGAGDHARGLTSGGDPLGGGAGGGSGGGAAGAGSGGGGGGSGGGGGKLPFTGYAVLFTAAVGASFAGIGAAVRARLRRDGRAPG